MCAHVLPDNGYTSHVHIVICFVASPRKVNKLFIFALCAARFNVRWQSSRMSSGHRVSQGIHTLSRKVLHNHTCTLISLCGELC